MRNFKTIKSRDMKINYKYRHSVAMLIIASVVATSCSKSFSNRPPVDAIAIDNFYQNDAQVQASTNILYGAPWFGYQTKVGWSITELYGGNGRTYSGDVINFGNFSVTSLNFEIQAAWNSLFTEVAEANALLTTLPVKSSPSVDSSVLINALAEAHFWRAMAYFHLVRIFGPVPIIENYTKYLNNYQLNTNPVPDVYKFIVNDLKYAEANLVHMIRSGASVAQGRVSSGSASAVLSKVYLYMQDYADAQAEAQKVINSGEFKLYGVDVPGKTFSDLFLTANNNNEESVVAVQWAGGAPYGLGNATQAAWAYNSQITGFNDGYGQLGPTFSLFDEYDTANDKRFRPTIMMPGSHYSYIDAANGGYTLPATASSQGTAMEPKKYVVGTAADNGGVGAAQSMPNNTYLMRYSEVYLILAEAIMAGAKTSTDPQALAAINIVRGRAGLSPLDSIRRGYNTPNNALAYYAFAGNAPATLYRDDILEERRREFALENDYWYDLARLDGYNVTHHPIAELIISQQDRGTTGGTATSGRYGNGFMTITDAQFLLPIPATETSADPLLLQPPQPYHF
jgi:starch-binding outer membrane protein, SusD/RagB family